MITPVSKKKRILVDGRFIGIGDSISRYTLELIGGIIELDSDFEFTLLVRPQGETVAQQFLSDRKNRSKNNPTIEVNDIPHYSLAEQTKFLKYLNQKKFDLVHFVQFNHPIRYRGNFVVTIHDLTLFGHLYRKSKIKSLAFQQVMKSAIKNSSRIITVSQTSKQAISENYNVDPKKIDVTYLGVDANYNSNLRNQVSKIEDVKDNYQIKGDYLLYTGMWKRHKNLLRMLKAFEQYRLRNLDSKIQMVLVGKIDRNEPEVLAEINRINKENAKLFYGSIVSNSNEPMKQLDNCILPIGFVDEIDLPYLYAGATAYIMPSLSEGFGLPPLEAMACGTPVISSNASAMPEILGPAALYFDPYNGKDIEKAIEKISSDEKLHDELSRKGIDQASRYRWNRTAEETLKIYKEIL